MRRKEMQSLIDEKNGRVLALEAKVETLEKQVETYRGRENSIIDSLASAKLAAESLLSESEARAKETQSSAQAQAEAILRDANSQSDEILRNAREEAHRILADARNRYTAAVADAERDTQELLAEKKRLTDELFAQAEAARNAAKTFEAMLVRVGGEAAENGNGGDDEGEPIFPFAALTSAESLFAEDDPKSVMQSIYRLQNREVPEAEIVPEAADGAQETVPDFAPRPEDAAEASAPKVSELVSGDEKPQEEELSLDALLDEIIHSGE